MSDLLIKYMFPSAISLLVFYALFAMTLRNETFFGWNRMFLVMSMVVSFILPWIHLSLPVPLPSSELITYTLSFTSQEVVVTADAPEKFSFLSFFAMGRQFLFYAYLAGVIFFTLRMLAGLCRILYLIYQYGIVRHQDTKVVFMYNNIPHFSFFNLVFINRNFLETAQDEALILIHEKEHLRQRHFIDLILLELLIVFQWFNPAAWLYRHSLKRIHEYQADRAVVSRGHEMTAYMCLIFNQVSGFRPDVFINKFNFFTLKKRIIMMSKSKSSEWAKSRILLAVPIVALLLLGFGFRANSQENNMTVNVMLETPDNTTNMTVNVMMDNVGAGETTVMVDINPDGSIGLIQSLAISDTTKTNIPATNEEVFVIVDAPPTYPGGDDARLEFLRSNINYPPAAKEKGIQGTVYIGFVVEKDGTVNDVKVMRGIHKLLDDEALRVTKLMPKWTPGRQKGEIVRVSYNMPIKFTIPAKTETTAAPTTNEEVFVIVDAPPTYPGGDEARLEFLKSNIQYPQEAKEKGIQGMVYVGFIVEKDGTVNDVKLLRGVDKLIDDEALRVVKLMPKWTPGRQKGEIVRVSYNMPIKFTLSTETENE